MKEHIGPNNCVDNMCDANTISKYVIIARYIQYFSEKCPKICIQNVEEYTSPSNYLIRCMMQIYSIMVDNDYNIHTKWIF